MKKSIISVFLVLALALTLLHGTALGAGTASGSCGAEGADVKWLLSDGVLTISGTGDMRQFQPNKESDPAKMVPWLDHMTSIRQVIIKEGVTSIGNYAFWGFTNMTSISIADSVRYIGIDSFCNCSSLTSIDLPESLDTIDAAAFAQCTNLKRVDIPAGVTKIGNVAFNSCGSGLEIHFQGNAPAALPEAGSSGRAFDPDVTLYYRPGTSGWTNNKEYDAAKGTWRGYKLLPEDGTAPSGPSDATDPDLPDDPFTIKISGAVVRKDYYTYTIPAGATGTISFAKSGGWAFAGKGYENPEYCCDVYDYTELDPATSLIYFCYDLTAKYSGSMFFSLDNQVFTLTVVGGEPWPGYDIQVTSVPKIPETGNNTYSMTVGQSAEFTFKVSPIPEGLFSSSWAETDEGVTIEKLSDNDDLFYDGITRYSIKAVSPGSTQLYLGGKSFTFTVTGSAEGKVLELFPANGSGDFGTDEPNLNGVRANGFTIRFDKPLKLSNNMPVLNTGAGKIALHDSGGKVIWEAQTFGRNTCTDIVVVASTGETAFRIAPGNLPLGSLLGYGQSYYITIDPGVIQFADGTSFGGLGAGEWKFSTIAGPEPILPVSKTIDVRFDTGFDSEVTVKADWEDSWFSKTSDYYNHDLAKTCMALTSSAYIRGATAEALRQVGFEDANIESNVNIDHEFDLGDESDYVDYSIGYKELGDGGVRPVGGLVVITVRGSREAGEWASNFWMGSGEDHEGFKGAEQDLMTQLLSFLVDRGLDKDTGKLKFLLTGHSRGAAVVNLAAVDIAEKYTSAKNVYAYTFACPNVSKSVSRGYENIFNIINPEDVAPKVPLSVWGYGRNGVDLLLPCKTNYSSKSMRSLFNNLLSNTKDLFKQMTGKEYNSFLGTAIPGLGSLDDTLSTWRIEGLFKDSAEYWLEKVDHAHSCTTYYSWLMSGSLDEVYAGSEEIKRIKIACPVDVRVYDQDGVLVAEIVDEKITKDDLPVCVIGDMKVVDIPLDQPYSVEITARESGTMTYSVDEYFSGAQTDGPSRTVTINDVALSPDDVFTGKVDTAESSDKDEYAITRNGKTGIAPDSEELYRPVSFSDVDPAAYYANAVRWAVAKEITNGTPEGTFQPDAACTRAQIAAFLWRAYGSQEPAVTTSPFTDLDKDAYYYKAVLWAVENGVTQGTSATEFSPDAVCTRSQAVTLLYRAADTPAVSGKNEYADVPAGTYYHDAVLWATENNITNGTGGNNFSPDDICTRAQIVTFLWREMAAAPATK